MKKLLLAAILCCGSVALAEPAFAQGTGMPAGRAAATAPGGTEGIAGPRNVQRAMRRGQAVGYPRTRRYRRRH